MSSVDIIRAWKDEEFRASLSPEAQAQLPENPANCIELDDAALDQMHGGAPMTVTFDPCVVSLFIGCYPG